MDPISLTASLIAVLQVSSTVISTLYSYRHGVQNSHADVIRIISSLNSLQAVLESVLSLVEAGKLPESSVSQLPTLSQLMGPDGELQRLEANLTTLKGKIEPEKGWRAVRQALVWPLKEKEVKSMLDGIQRVQGLLHFALSADHMSLSMEIHKGVQSLTANAEESLASKQQEEFNKWIKAPDPFETHSVTRTSCQANTGNWFIRSKSYQDWKNGQGSLMWIYGIPGCGKSVLSSTVVEDIFDTCRSNTSFKTAYYYLTFNDTENQDTNSLLRALLSQLINQCPKSSPNLQKLCTQIKSSACIPTTEFLFVTLKSFVEELAYVYIIIDALDEASDCEILAEYVSAMACWRIPHLHILVTSRQLTEIEDEIALCASESICLQESEISTDIAAYVHERLSCDKKLQKWPKAVQNDIQRILTHGAHGMFRWVACQLDMLRKCMTTSALYTALNSLPKTLHETYGRILLSIDETYSQDVIKILQALSFSPRILTIFELVELLAIDIDCSEPKYVPENIMAEPMDLVTLCGPLVTICVENRLGLEMEEQTVFTLRLAHFSVKEYLISERIRNSSAAMYALNSDQSHRFLAKAYLVYLLSPMLISISSWAKTAPDAIPEFTLLPTAALHWPAHVKALGASLPSDIEALMEKLFDSKSQPGGGSYAVWLWSFIPGRSSIILNTPALYYAASFGLLPMVVKLIASTPEIDIDIKGGRAYSTPLQVACMRGELEVAKLLLKAGADPNSINIEGYPCLYFAAVYSHTEIVQLLRSYGAKDDFNETRCQLRSKSDKF